MIWQGLDEIRSVTNSWSVYFPFSLPRGMIRYLPFSIRSMNPFSSMRERMTQSISFLMWVFSYNWAMKIPVLFCHGLQDLDCQYPLLLPNSSLGTPTLTFMLILVYGRGIWLGRTGNR